MCGRALLAGGGSMLLKRSHGEAVDHDEDIVVEFKSFKEYA